MKIYGVVMRGDRRGREIGFPTVNIQPKKNIHLPKAGVYAGWVTIAHNQRRLPAAIHIGPRPTIADATISVEAHILDFEKDLYDQTICIETSEFLREIKKFDSMEELQHAIMLDCKKVRDILEP